MSLEEALKENTRIMQELVAALNAASLHGQEAAKSPAVTKPAVAPKPVAKAPAPVAKPAAKPVAKAAPAPEPEAEDGAVTYDQVKAAILALGNAEGKGRPAVAAVLEQFGVAKGPDLQADQYAEALEALTAALAE